MGSFSKYANLYFSIARKIIEMSNKNGGISESEINRIAHDYGVSEDYMDFVRGITSKQDEDNKFNGLAVLKSIGDKKYQSIIDALPLILSKEEKEALFDILTSDMALAFISDNTLSKLGITSKVSLNNVMLGKVVNAFKYDKWLMFDNNAANGQVYSRQHLKPQKLEYSLITKELFVTGYCKESARLIKCNLERLVIHNIEDGEIIDMDSALEQRRCKEPIRLSIENQKNAIDRAFNMFSIYEKDGFFDKKTGRYMLDLYYYEFEEGILTDKIISIGAAVFVASPTIIQEKIKRRVQEQLLKLT